MKLTDELKKKIDSYFDKVTSEELYRISSIKYGFTEDLSMKIKREGFVHAKVDTYKTNLKYSNQTSMTSDTMPQAA